MDAFLREIGDKKFTIELAYRLLTLLPYWILNIKYLLIMSDEKFQLNRYNFSRRVVDHRYPHDFFYSINKSPWSAQWILATRNWMIGGYIPLIIIHRLVSRLSTVICCGAFAITLIGAELNMYMRENDDEFARSALTRGRYDLTHPPNIIIDTQHLSITHCIITINLLRRDNGTTISNAGRMILSVQKIFESNTI